MDSFCPVWKYGDVPENEAKPFHKPCGKTNKKADVADPDLQPVAGRTIYVAMNIAVACGGTGGHIFPGLATARALQARGHAVTLWLVGRDVESSSVEGWQGGIISIRASGFPSGVSVQSVLSVLRLASATFAAVRRMHAAPPDALLCMGSYASVAPCLAARLLGIPVVLHEANAIPGRAIAFLARFATRIAVGFEAALPYFTPAGKAVVTGFPLRDGFTAPERESRRQNLTLLVMGGSQGAHVLNERMPAVAAALQVQKGRALHVIHLAGRHEAGLVESAYRTLGVEAEVYAFSSEMARLYAQADLVVARSGAATCTELAVCGLPAVLVPLPHAARNHQMRNAEAMAAGGGMLVMPEAEFTVENMVQRIYTLISNPAALRLMREALLKALPADGARRLADLVESVNSSR